MREVDPLYIKRSKHKAGIAAMMAAKPTFHIQKAEETMQGSVRNLVEIFHSYMEIPIYQRNYDWKKGNCDTLFDDLLRIAKEGKTKHFFGSIVRQNGYDGRTSQIIDGQQRITTVSLILCAMVNAAAKGEIEAEGENQINKIKYEYLIDQYEDKRRKIRLKPVQKDMEAFDFIVFGKPKEQWIRDSNITRNYNHLYERVIKSKLTLQQLIEAVMSLQVMDLYLEANDDAQLIFESLNSTGLALNEADKVRNYMLMNMSAEEQKHCYEDYWNEIERSTSVTGYEHNSTDNTTLFMRDYLTINTRRICRIENVYIEFKSFCENGEAMPRPERLADMLTYAKVYGNVLRAQSDSKIIRRKLKEIGNIVSRQHFPFILQFLVYAERSGLGETEIAEVIDVIEDFWARRIICNKPSNALNRIFCTLHNDVLKTLKKAEGEGQKIEYTDALKHVILSKGGSSCFPKDDEVALNITTRQVYSLPKPTKTFLFDRLENANDKEYLDVASEIRNGDISIEHIMPQSLSEEWKQSLGDNWDEVANKYMHTLANLTLTGYNSEYSNRTFQEKRDGIRAKDGSVIGGFKSSHYRLSETLKGLEQWTETEILERQRWITHRFLAIFPQLTSTLSATDTEVITLSDCDDSMTGRDIEGFRFDGAFVTCSTWREMFISVCKNLHHKHPDVIEAECAKNGAWLRSDENSLRPVKIADSCYVDTNNSTSQKIKYLQSIFDMCGISEDELELSLKPVKAEQVNG